jgi:hypothetical protein
MRSRDFPPRRCDRGIDQSARWPIGSDGLKLTLDLADLMSGGLAFLARCRKRRHRNAERGLPGGGSRSPTREPFPSWLRASVDCRRAERRDENLERKTWSGSLPS